MIIGEFVHCGKLEATINSAIKDLGRARCYKYQIGSEQQKLWCEGVRAGLVAVLDYLKTCEKVSGIAEWNGGVY